MSKSNDNGRALEFAYLTELAKELLLFKNVVVEETDGFEATKKAWNKASDEEKETFISSAKAGIKAILDCEPLLVDNADDTLQLRIPTDDRGRDGDVRDIIIVRSEIGWEIGISVKNNHSAVKHPRFSSVLDFGEKWFGIKCSDDYWKSIKPIFDDLNVKKQEGLNWNELSFKEDSVYVPLLSAFLAEITNSYDLHGEDLAQNMVEYLIGKHDFYKAIGRNRQRITEVQPYNLRGTLNHPSSYSKPKVIIPPAFLPKRIVLADFVPESKTTIEIIFDEGWHMTFRLHNASSRVEPSLKFDVQFKGMPANIICIEYKWD